MGQPNPPGDIPLFDGLGPEWNDIVGAFPEDKRGELAPKLRERIEQYEPLKQWEDFQKSGITPDFAQTAVNLFAHIENNPRQVYDEIGKFLGISAQQAKEVVDDIKDDVKETDEDDPRYSALKQQLDAISQILLTENQTKMQAQQEAEAQAAIENEFSALKKKVGDFDEEEVIMRMVHKGISAEQAYNEYTAKVDQLRARRPAPMLLGSGGAIPQRSIDPTKLNNQDTKSLVVQMLEHAKNQ